MVPCGGSTPPLPPTYKGRVCGRLYMHRHVGVIWTGTSLMCRHQRPRRKLQDCKSCKARIETIKGLLNKACGHTTDVARTDGNGAAAATSDGREGCTL